MYLKHLSLINFRNYRQLELDFPQPLTLLQGPNAQGKTNLLEAIYYLATSRSPLGRPDRQVIHWDLEGKPIPYARLAAEVEKTGQCVTLEVIIAPTGADNKTAGFRKLIRVNGLPRRGIDLVGELKVVLFLPQDIDLVAGSPAGRRHYLDVALCQCDRAYCQNLTQYNQILPRRNSLLRQLSERGGDPEQLAYWDEQLAERAAHLIVARQRAVNMIADSAMKIHFDLTDGRESLSMSYRPSFLPTGLEVSDDALAGAYLARLRETRQREIAAGATLIGPHRDDLQFTVAGHDLGQFGSRGQQRTASLALKLAEVEFMTAQTGEPPILLLDDVMSELDEERRRDLERILERACQAIITTTDLTDYRPAFMNKAMVWHVMAGALLPL